MIEVNGTVVLSALLGSLVGFIVASLLVYMGWVVLKPKLVCSLEQYLENRLKRERAQFGTEIQTRVTQGVTEGIADGVAAIPSTQVLRRTRQTMAKTGREIVGSGFQSLFGKRPMTEQVSEPPSATPERCGPDAQDLNEPPPRTR